MNHLPHPDDGAYGPRSTAALLASNEHRGHVIAWFKGDLLCLACEIVLYYGQEFSKKDLIKQLRWLADAREERLAGKKISTVVEYYAASHQDRIYHLQAQTARDLASILEGQADEASGWLTESQLDEWQEIKDGSL